ncbi:MAG: hypothetical protein ABEJ30_08740 [Halorientalis sp.]
MEIKDKPATPIPSWLLGALLLAVGLAFIVDFLSRAAYAPAVMNDPSSLLAITVVGIVAGAVLVGVGVAAVLQSSGYVDLPFDLG